jgi:hypothetical protein
MAVEAVASENPAFFDTLGGASVISGLGGLAQSLAEFIFGSGRKRAIKKQIGSYQGQLGKDVMSPAEQEAIMAHLYRSMYPRFNQQAEGINKRLGLDSGVAQAELASGMQSTEAGLRGGLAQQNIQLRSQRDDQLRQLMASLTGQL